MENNLNEEINAQNAHDYEAAYALQKEKEGFKRDMGWFGKYCFPKALAKDTPDFHRDIYKELKNDNTKRNIPVAVILIRSSIKNNFIVRRNPQVQLRALSHFARSPYQ